MSKTSAMFDYFYQRSMSAKRLDAVRHRFTSSHTRTHQLTENAHTAPTQNVRTKSLKRKQIL